SGAEVSPSRQAGASAVTAGRARSAAPSPSGRFRDAERHPGAVAPGPGGLRATNPQRPEGGRGMLIGIEGTGTNWAVRANFSAQRGFIWQFLMNYAPGHGSVHYFSGPCLHGENCLAIMGDAVRAVEAELRADAKQEINIIGYSRGGFIAMAVARHVGLALK